MNKLSCFICKMSLVVGFAVSLCSAAAKDTPAKEPEWKDDCLELLCRATEKYPFAKRREVSTSDVRAAAMKRLEEQAEKGDKLAILALAALDEAWLDKAVETGSPDAMYMKGWVDGSEEVRRAMYKSAAEKGHAGAIQWLCDYTRFDIESFWDEDKELVNLYAAAEKLAKKGNVPLMSTLGRVIINISGAYIQEMESALQNETLSRSERDRYARVIKWCKAMPKTGIRWLVKAAESGHDATVRKLMPDIIAQWAEIGRVRKVTSSDKKKLESARSKGWAVAEKAKGLCERAREAWEDPQKAMAYYQEAVKIAPASEYGICAKAELALLYLTGKAGKVDKKAALQLLSSVFEDGCCGGEYGAIFYLLRK